MSHQDNGDFTAVDIELANNEYHSTCEIGIARFRQAHLIETWRTLVDPRTQFLQAFHSQVHGITASHVAGAATFPEICSVIERFVNKETCVFHASNDFDRQCISSACRYYGLDDITANGDWVSTSDLCRHKWPGESDYKLTSLCDRINHRYQPHNALEDAVAAAALYLDICRLGNAPCLSSNSHEDSEVRTYRQATQERKTGLKGNSEGKFYKTYIVLTGTFCPPYEDRENFRLYLNNLGFVPATSISGRTQYLVVGQDPGPSKIEKAKNNGVEILTEAEFLALIDSGL